MALLPPAFVDRLASVVHVVSVGILLSVGAKCVFTGCGVVWCVCVCVFVCAECAAYCTKSSGAWASTEDAVADTVEDHSLRLVVSVASCLTSSTRGCTQCR